jgi:hypothetical protein
MHWQHHKLIEMQLSRSFDSIESMIGDNEDVVGANSDGQGEDEVLANCNCSVQMLKQSYVSIKVHEKYDTIDDDDDDDDDHDKFVMEDKPFPPYQQELAQAACNSSPISSTLEPFRCMFHGSIGRILLTIFSLTFLILIAAEILLFIQEENVFLYTGGYSKASNYYASQSHIVHEEFLRMIPTYQSLLKQELQAGLKKFGSVMKNEMVILLEEHTKQDGFRVCLTAGR